MKQTQTPDTTKQYHIDCEFEGERLVDDVTLIERLLPRDKKALVYSPKLKANILIPRTELRPPPTKQSYVEPSIGKWKVKTPFKFQFGNVLVETEKQVICRIMENDYDTDQQAEANAKLIAAAPEIAKALQEIKNEGRKLLSLYALSDHYTEADIYKLFRTGVGNWIEKAESVLKEAGLTNE